MYGLSLFYTFRYGFIDSCVWGSTGYFFMKTGLSGQVRNEGYLASGSPASPWWPNNILELEITREEYPPVNIMSQLEFEVYSELNLQPKRTSRFAPGFHHNIFKRYFSRPVAMVSRVTLRKCLIDISSHIFTIVLRTTSIWSFPEFQDFYFIYKVSAVGNMNYYLTNDIFQYVVVKLW